jgi:CHRD domain
MRQAPWLVVTIIGTFLLCGGARAEQINFKADLSGASEVPPVTGPGSGSAMASLDTASKTLTWTVTYSGLSGPVTAGHIHGPAAPGANAGVLVPFSGNLTSPIKGSATLTDAQISDLEAGRTYVNLHTAAHPSGELRGQLVRAQ